MNCLIVEDEPLARQLLESYIGRVDGLRLIRSCVHALEAFAVLQQKPIDLLFLDIQMPQVTGIDLLKSLKTKPPVILTTAYRDYAVDAFELDAIDYLVKPIAFERFLRAIGKVYNRQLADPLPVARPIMPAYEDAYTYLKAARGMVKVYLKDILYVESLRDYVRVKTRERDLIAYQKIGYLEQKLPQTKFIRVHRSFIVAIDQVTTYTTATVSVGQLLIPIGRSYKLPVLRAMARQDSLL